MRWLFPYKIPTVCIRTDKISQFHIPEILQKHLMNVMLVKCFQCSTVFKLGILNLFFLNSNFVCKIRILFELRLGLRYGEFVLTLTVCLQYFTQHGFDVMVLNFGTRWHFSFINCMFFNVLCSYSTAIKTTTSVHCQSLLSKNSGQISIRDSNAKCMKIKLES